jgi:hypothetical protein
MYATWRTRAAIATIKIEPAKEHNRYPRVEAKMLALVMMDAY